MSDDNVLNPSEASEDLTPFHREIASRTDPILVEWLNIFDRTGISTEITINIDGFLIFGTPITLADFERQVGKTLEQGFIALADRQADEDASESWRDIGAKIRAKVDEMAASYEIRPGSEAGSEEDSSGEQALQHSLRQHIMLKHVVMLSPAGERFHVPYWRGRLGHVSGWFLGRSGEHEYEGIKVD